MKFINVMVFLVIVVIFSLVIPQPALADCFSDCIGQGNDPSTCNLRCNPSTGATGGLGEVTNPIPTSSSAPGGGLIILLNNILRLVFVGAGIYAFIRIIIAGLGFISAGGDVKKITSAWNSIWQSLLGLIIIVGSFAIAALIGQILFGNPGAILNPTIYGPGT